MDDPELSEQEHVAALHGLARINRASRSGALMWKRIREIALESPNTPLRILDIATGSGDLPVELLRRANRANIALEITALDISERAVGFARQQANQAGVSIDFRKAGVLNGDLPGEYDVVMSSLFLHHLETPDVSRLLLKMGAATRHCVLINDLRRSRMSYCLAQVACRVLTRSRVVHVDGPLSVQAAFTVVEMRQLMANVGMETAVITSHWPARLLVQWMK